MEVATTTLHLSDELLFEKIKKDDHSAYTQLYKRYKKPLAHFAFGYLNDKTHIEEIVQEFFLQLWRKRKSIVINRSLAHYFFRSIRNRIINHYRKHSAFKKNISLTDLSGILSEEEIFENLERRERERRVKQLVDSLPQHYKEVFILRIQYALSNKKTAKILQRSSHTVDKQIRRVAYILGEKLSENGCQSFSF